MPRKGYLTRSLGDLWNSWRSMERWSRQTMTAWNGKRSTGRHSTWGEGCTPYGRSSQSVSQSVIVESRVHAMPCDAMPLPCYALRDRAGRASWDGHNTGRTRIPEYQNTNSLVRRWYGMMQEPSPPLGDELVGPNGDSVEVWNGELARRGKSFRSFGVGCDGKIRIPYYTRWSYAANQIRWVGQGRAAEGTVGGARLAEQRAWGVLVSLSCSRPHSHPGEFGGV